MWVPFFTGSKVTRLINEQGDNTLGYDDLGRLSSRVPTGGASGPTLSWTYDRYGNRLSQTASGTGSSSFPQPAFNVTTSNNHVDTFTYDLAGNVINDGMHTYTYDQEGNLIYVDNGQTAWDNYDALNRRILHATGNYTNYLRYEYDLDGKLAGVWQNEETYEKLNRYYGPKGDSFAYWTGGTNLSNEVVHYQHTDYLGTVKARTDQNHNVEAYYSDLPFGERVPMAGTDDNTEHYATLDRDTESDTHHAHFRTYEPRIGRWLQPDPYDGSYGGNPQSWNRYSYVMNNPFGFVDSSGLDETEPCLNQDADMVTDDEDDDNNVNMSTDCVAGGGGSLLGGGTPVDDNGNGTYTISITHTEYTVNDPGPTVFFPSVPSIYDYQLPTTDPTLFAQNAGPANDKFPYGWPFNGNMIPRKPQKQDNQCTTGPMSGPMNRNPAVLSCCQKHDNCYAANQCNASSWIPNPLPWGACNTCNAKAAACITGAVLGH